jgi:hypothetical protein
MQTDKHTLKQQLKDRWKNSVPLFLKQCLGGEYKTIKPFQIRMLMHPGAKKQGRTFKIRLLPRDSGKSWLGIGEMTHIVANFPNDATSIVSETQTTSMLFLTEVKDHLAVNETIKEYYGNQKGAVWSAKKIVSAQRTNVRKEPTIECVGMGGAMVARHVEHQYFDDVVSESNSETPLSQEKQKYWYSKVALPILMQGGTQVVNGTLYFPNDLYSYLIGQYGQEALYRVPALTKKDSVERSYFPERYPVDILQEIRRANPYTFALQYNNEVDVLLSRIITRDAIVICRESELPPFNELSFYIGVDPATSLKSDSCYFATVTIGYHSATHKKYVIRYTKDKLGDPEAMLKRIVEEWLYVVERGGEVFVVGVESNGFQGVLAKAMYADPARFGLLPVYEVITHKDKVQRLIAQAHHYNTSSVVFVEDIYELVERLLKFPNITDNDDIDALMIAMQCIEETQSDSILLPVEVKKLLGIDNIYRTENSTDSNQGERERPIVLSAKSKKMSKELHRGGDTGVDNFISVETEF